MKCHSLFRFRQKGTRDRHEKTHNEPKKFQCQKCNKTFRRKESLKFHLANTHKEGVINVHQCNMCERSYTHKNTLILHRMTMHSSKPPKYRCVVCKTTFRNKRILLDHMMIHKPRHERMLFTCSLCSAKFTTKSILKMHCKSVHLKIKEHECSTCNERLVWIMEAQCSIQFLTKPFGLFLK